MAAAPRPCPSPHPIRGSGYDHQGDPEPWAPTIELMGWYEDSCWLRCRQCGAWFWVVSDSSRFAYQNEWRLPTDAAQHALLGHEPGAVVALLVEQGLPHGPLWELASARVGLLRHLTPGHDDRERIAALQAVGSLNLVWADALALLIDEHAAALRSVRAPKLEFIVDLPRDMSGCDELFELPGAVIAPLRDIHRLLRFNEEGGVEIPLAGPPRWLANHADSLLFMIESETPGLLLLRPETMLALPLQADARLLALAVDRGHYLLIPDPAPTSEGPRRVELRDGKLEFRASLPMVIEPRSPYPTSPRAMGEGWLFSNVVNDAGEQIAMCLFDEHWQVLAYTRGVEGARMLDPIDEARVLAVPLMGPGALEGWQREGDRLERMFEVACHTHVRLDERIVCSEGGELFGCDVAGVQRWRTRIGPLNVQMIALGPSCVLICGDRLLALINPDTGEVLERVEGAIEDGVFVDRVGWAHLMFGATLLSCGPSGTIERTLLDGEYELVGSAGIGVIARRVDEARHLWIAGPGELVGEFEAGDPRWSVCGSVAGPHVLEGDRLRIHRLPGGG